MLRVAVPRLDEKILVVGIQLLAHDGIGVTQDAELLGRHLANDANGQARTRERLAVHHLLRQAQRHAQFAHLVLKEVVKRLDEVKVHALGEGNEVVVALDGGRLAARLARAALDDVGIDGALCHEAYAVQLLGLLEEHLPELGANATALLLGVGHARQQRDIALFGVHMHQRHVKLPAEDLLN